MVNRFSSNYSLSGFLYDIGLIYTKVLNNKELEANTQAQPK